MQLVKKPDANEAQTLKNMWNLVVVFTPLAPGMEFPKG